jgi:CheY-like chemotaxis protein
MAKVIDSSSPLVAEHMRNASVLVADLSATSRPLIRKLMSALGAKTTSVVVAESFAEAAARLGTLKPAVVFADLQLGDRSGLELVEAYGKVVPDRLKSLFIVLASSPSGADFAAVAESEADALWPRPRTYAELQDRFLAALAPKLEPSLAMKLVEAGRRFLAAGNAEGAFKAAREAVAKDPGLVAAHWLEGKARVAMNDPDGALVAFQGALAIDPNHFRSLTAIFDLHLLSKRYPEAFETGMTLGTVFPLDPKRIPEMIRLCILNERYSEILPFYDRVMELGGVDEALSRYLSAGLVICGKHLIARGEKDEAVKVFRKAEVASKSKPVVMREIIVALYGATLAQESEELRKRASAEVGSATDVLLAELEHLHLAGPDPKVFLKAQELLARGVSTLRLFEIAVTQARALKRPANAILELAHKGGAAFPDHKEHLLLLARD